MKRVFLPLLLLLCLPCGARTPDDFVGKLQQALSRPNPKLDSTYIVQPVRPWTVSLYNDLFWTGTDIRTDISFHFEDGVIEYGTRTYLYPPMADKLSLYVAYGSARLGFGFVIGREGTSARSNSCSLLRPAFGINFQYHRLQGRPRTVLESTEDEAEWVSDLPATLRIISADAYYAFNNTRFVYNAAYNATYLQRRSAGSFLLAGGYQYGDIQLPADDKILLAGNASIGRYRTHQFSIGGGYGYNWVLLHRDARPDDEGSLRNLTANITLTPMAVALNRMIYTTWGFDNIDSASLEDETFRLWGGMGFNMVARCALCYTFGRCSMGASLRFNQFQMSGSKRFSDETGYEDVTIANRFHDWSTTLRFDIRF